MSVTDTLSTSIQTTAGQWVGFPGAGPYPIISFRLTHYAYNNLVVWDLASSLVFDESLNPVLTLSSSLFPPWVTASRQYEVTNSSTIQPVVYRNDPNIVFDFPAGASGTVQVTNPILNNVAVFGSSTNDPASLKSTDTAATITASTTAALSVRSTITTCAVNVGTTNLGSNRGSIVFGRNSLWELCTDSSANGTLNFVLFAPGGVVFTVLSSTRIFAITIGATSPYYGLTSSAAATPLAIWLDSANLASPSYASSGRLALLSEVATASTPVSSTVLTTSDPWAARRTVTYSYQKIGNTVHVQLICTTAAATANAPILLASFLPVGLRPPSAIQPTLVVIDNSANTTGFAQISTAGDITISPLNVNFTTGISGFISANLTFMV